MNALAIFFFSVIASRHESSHSGAFQLQVQARFEFHCNPVTSFWSHYCKSLFSANGHSVFSGAVDASRIRHCGDDYPNNVALTVLIRSRHLRCEHSNASQCHCPHYLFGCDDSSSSVPIQQSTLWLPLHCRISDGCHVPR
jgi:hypothetical protein